MQGKTPRILLREVVYTFPLLNVTLKFNFKYTLILKADEKINSAIFTHLAYESYAGWLFFLLKHKINYGIANNWTL